VVLDHFVDQILNGLICDIDLLHGGSHCWPVRAHSFSGTSVTVPCSRLSIPNAVASRNPIEERCPLALKPRA